MGRCTMPDVRKILKLYYSKTELVNDDIMYLFGVGRSAATNMKKPIYEKMAQEGIRTFLPHAVNMKVAFEVWGFDVEECEKRFAKLKKLGLEENVC